MDLDDPGDSGAAHDADHPELMVAGREVAWDDLRMFRLVAQELSFTKAARRAQVSQPSLSSRVKRLERRLGVVLLERSTRRVHLTPAGILVLNGVEAMMSAWSGAAVALSEANGSDRPARPVRLGLFDVRPRRFPPYVDTLTARGRCTLLVQGNLDEALTSLVDGRLDLLFAYHFDAEDVSAAPAGITTVTVIRERLHVLLPRGHRLADRSTVSLTELSTERWIVQVDPRLARSQVELLRRYGIDAQVVHVTSDTPTQEYLVASGQGVDVCSPLHRPAPGTVAKPLTEAIDSDFRLCIAPQVAPATGEAAVEALRRWYVDGLISRGSPWLHRMSRPDAHPTLRAALVAGLGTDAPDGS